MTEFKLTNPDPRQLRAQELMAISEKNFAKLHKEAILKLRRLMPEKGHWVQTSYLKRLVFDLHDEVAELHMAIRCGDPSDIKDELRDVLNMALIIDDFIEQTGELE